MKALVLAAGFGSRLRDRSESKPLTPVGGVPLIEHVIASAAGAGISEFVVVTGHQADRVEAFLADLRLRLGVPIDWVRAADWTRPNGFSVLDAADRLVGDYLLLMADHLFDPAIVARLLAAPRAGIGLRLAVDRDVESPTLDLDDATKVEVGRDGRIVRIGKTLSRFDAIDTGIFLATPALADAIRADVAAGGGGSLSEGVQALADRGLAQTLETSGAAWLDVDDPRSLELAESLVAVGAFRDSAV